MAAATWYLRGHYKTNSTYNNLAARQARYLSDGTTIKHETMDTRFEFGMVVSFEFTPFTDTVAQFSLVQGSYGSRRCYHEAPEECVT